MFVNVEGLCIVVEPCDCTGTRRHIVTGGFCRPIFQSDVAIFFELWHYKQKKNKRSSKCFSFLEREEITKGPAVLEV